MPPELWHQHNIGFTDREAARDVIVERLGPALRDAEARGQIAGWWFMNKQPWPLRYRAEVPSPAIELLLSELGASGVVETSSRSVYEPEIHTFGGPEAMDAAHELFHRDSFHLLSYQPSPKHLGRRETTVLLVSAMLRGAGLDWFEQGDVWSKVADLRPASAPLPCETAPQLAPAVRKLMTADAHELCRPGRPLHTHDAWVTAFARTGATLTELAKRGFLTRGLRAVLAHHTIFHANRAGLPLDDQSTLSHIAREVIMGTSDHPTPVDTKATAGDATEVEPAASSTSEAERLRNALVDQLRASGNVHTARVESALRTVPRHLFVPDAPLQDAYANAPVHIKYDTDGTSISCASQPGVVALMLEQLDVQPGEHVLELGAGTGYNAALLGQLVGGSGHVTTLDVDDDLVEGARRNLAAADVSNVRAVTRDGALGYEEGAPYDRIIATVGARGVPHAWLEQLAPGGRLLVPQRLTGTVSRSIAYEWRDGRLKSLSSEMNTFMPLRHGIADDDRHVIPLTSDGTVRLQAPAGERIDAEALAGVLDQPRTEEWTDTTFRAMESPEWMELFLACSLPSGLIRMLFPQTAKGAQLADDPYPSSTAAVDGGAITYLARRLSHRKTAEGAKLWEFGVIGHGPGSGELAVKVADLIRTWDWDFRDREATFEIQSLDSHVEHRPGLFTLDTPLNRIVVDWQ